MESPRLPNQPFCLDPNRVAAGERLHRMRSRSLHAPAFHDPTLPEFLDLVELKNLRVGQARVDLVIQRQAHDVSVNLVRRATGVRVIVTK